MINFTGSSAVTSFHVSWTGKERARFKNSTLDIELEQTVCDFQPTRPKTSPVNSFTTPSSVRCAGGSSVCEKRSGPDASVWRFCFLCRAGGLWEGRGAPRRRHLSTPRASAGLREHALRRHAEGCWPDGRRRLRTARRKLWIIWGGRRDTEEPWTVRRRSTEEGQEVESSYTADWKWVLKGL